MGALDSHWLTQEIPAFDLLRDLLTPKHQLASDFDSIAHPSVRSRQKSNQLLFSSRRFVGASIIWNRRFDEAGKIYDRPRKKKCLFSVSSRIELLCFFRLELSYTWHSSRPSRWWVLDHCSKIHSFEEKQAKSEQMNKKKNKSKNAKILKKVALSLSRDKSRNCSESCYRGPPPIPMHKLSAAAHNHFIAFTFAKFVQANCFAAPFWFVFFCFHWFAFSRKKKKHKKKELFQARFQVKCQAPNFAFFREKKLDFENLQNWPTADFYVFIAFIGLDRQKTGS